MKRVSLISHLTSVFPQMSKKELFSRVLCGEVEVNGEKVRDPKRAVPADAAVEIVSRSYVSRGGEKLERALEVWNIRVSGKVFLDAGASTGGFTDCLLQHGAAFVHSVDVGYNQLAYRIRSDERVHAMERTNIMHVQSLDPAPEAAVADLSFRSLRGAAAHILSLTSRGLLIALLKPQFEYRPCHRASDDEEFSGVVDRPETVERIIHTVLEDLEAEGLRVHGIVPSPIRGHRGNREFLLLLKSGEGARPVQEFRENDLSDVSPDAGDWRKELSRAIDEAYESF